MADKLIDSNILNKLYSGKTLTEKEWDEYLKWCEPEEDDDEDEDVDEKALQEAKKSVEGEVFGMYGNIAKRYFLEDYPEKGAEMGAKLVEHLHWVDKEARRRDEELTELYKKQLKETDNYIEKVKQLTMISDTVREQVLNELVYI